MIIGNGNGSGSGDSSGNGNGGDDGQVEFGMKTHRSNGNGGNGKVQLGTYRGSRWYHQGSVLNNMLLEF
jgi:hypothetical protein